MCNTINFFQDLRAIEGAHHTITIPNGSKMLVNQIGIVCLNGGLVLTDVLFVPYIHFNLISVSKLTIEKLMDVLFTNNCCYLQDHLMKRVLPLGKLHHGLYYTLDKALIHTHNVKIPFSTRRLVTVTSKDTLQKLIHLRLGHLPFPRMKLLFPSLDVKAVQDIFVCSICPFARQTRLALPHNHVKTTSLFELLHVDVWGLNANKTHCGCTLFLTVMDDYSRSTWV